MRRGKVIDQLAAGTVWQVSEDFIARAHNLGCGDHDGEVTELLRRI
jgi:hypothetical protein